MYDKGNYSGGGVYRSNNDSLRGNQPTAEQVEQNDRDLANFGNGQYSGGGVFGENAFYTGDEPVQQSDSSALHNPAQYEAFIAPLDGETTLESAPNDNSPRFDNEFAPRMRAREGRTAAALPPVTRAVSRKDYLELVTQNLMNADNPNPTEVANLCSFALKNNNLGAEQRDNLNSYRNRLSTCHIDKDGKKNADTSCALKLCKQALDCLMDCLKVGCANGVTLEMLSKL